MLPAEALRAVLLRERYSTVSAFGSDPRVDSADRGGTSLLPVSRGGRESIEKALHKHGRSRKRRPNANETAKEMLRVESRYIAIWVG